MAAALWADLTAESAEDETEVLLFPSGGSGVHKAWGGS